MTDPKRGPSCAWGQDSAVGIGGWGGLSRDQQAICAPRVEQPLSLWLPAGGRHCLRLGQHAMSERGVRSCSVLVLCPQRRQHAVVQVDQSACRLVDDDVGDKRGASADLVFPVFVKCDQDTLIVSDDAVATVVI